MVVIKLNINDLEYVYVILGDAGAIRFAQNASAPITLTCYCRLNMLFSSIVF